MVENASFSLVIKCKPVSVRLRRYGLELIAPFYICRFFKCLTGPFPGLILNSQFCLMYWLQIVNFIGAD